MRRSQPGNENTFQVDTQDQDIKANIKNGRVQCHAFPIIIMTSNGERDFPPAFKRRCLRVRMPEPSEEALKTIVKAHFGEKSFEEAKSKIESLIRNFLEQRGNQSQERATDQLLNTIYLLTNGIDPLEKDEESLKEILFKSLTNSD
ncbi:MAG: hypothetical protein SAK29_29660 [Scytonema sp. PMC 1069.18]|nr:hypothetical protein [Scytonema sp. PMC 1069.18]